MRVGYSQPFKPTVKVGTVTEVAYDPIDGNWVIGVRHGNSFWDPMIDPDHVPYWAPFPEPPNTYTARDDEEDLHSFTRAYTRESNVNDYLSARADRNLKPE